MVARDAAPARESVAADAKSKAKAVPGAPPVSKAKAANVPPRHRM